MTESTEGVGTPTPLNKYRIEVDVMCQTLDQARQVAAERLGHDEDYGFEYRFGEEEVTVNSGKPDPEEDTYLQVFMVHDLQIQMFRRWVTENGWQLRPVPRFGEPDQYYTKTHHVMPNDAAMRAAGFPVPEKGTTND